MLVEILVSAISSIRINLFRNFLTILGIIIGVSSVIVIVSIMQGFSQSILTSFSGFGANSLTISAKESIELVQKGIYPKITDADLQSIKKDVSGIYNITPIIQLYELSDAKYKDYSSDTQVFASSHAYQDVNSSYPVLGRFITAEDNRTNRHVVVVGDKLLKNLKIKNDPLNKYIQLGGEWFKIIGVLEKKGSVFGFSQDDLAIIPYSTGKNILGNIEDPAFTIKFNMPDLDKLPLINNKIRNILRKNHRLKQSDEDDFEIQTPKQLMESFSDIIDNLTIVLASIVAISLLVGGIGVMNIMLVSVTERTKEIGICRALGASKNFIILQFLFESIILTFLGGLIGVIVGYGFSLLIALIDIFPDPHIPFWSIVLALFFSAIIGIVFGILPAIKAANLSPIKALNYE